MEYLGLILEHHQTHMDPVKVAGVRDWPTPTTIKEDTLFRFEVQGVFLCHSENIQDCVDMCLQRQDFSRDPNVVHVDPNEGSPGFMFGDSCIVDVIHEALKRGRQVTHTEEHYFRLV